MKRCSIDLSVLNTRFPTGISRYTECLIGEMLKNSRSDFGWFTSGTIEPPWVDYLDNRLCHLPYEFPIHNLEETGKQWSAILEIQRVGAHFSPYYPLPSISRVPTFFTIFDLLPLKFPEWFPNDHVRAFFNGPMRESACKASHLFAISESTKNDICEIFKVPPQKITVTHLAPTVYPSQTGDSKRPLNSPYFLCVGTLEPRKNLERTILAFEQLIYDCPELPHRLVLAGAYGWKSSHLFEHIKRLDSRVLETGYLSNSELATYYRHAETVVFASLAEGFGLPILESIECGIPVVTSGISSMPEVGGNVAIYCDPFSVDSISQAMKDSLKLEERERIRKLSNNHSKKFTWFETARLTIEKICSLW